MQNTSNKRRAVTIHPPARLVGEPKKTKKKGKKKDTQTVANCLGVFLWVSPRPPKSSDQNQTFMVSGLRCVVIHVMCDPSDQGVTAQWCRKWPFPITLASGLYNSLYYRTSRDTENWLMRLSWRRGCRRSELQFTASECRDSAYYNFWKLITIVLKYSVSEVAIGIRGRLSPWKVYSLNSACVPAGVRLQLKQLSHPL